MKYKVITEIEITIDGGTEKTRNKLANEITEAAILEGFATWDDDYIGMIGAADPDGACDADYGGMMGILDPDGACACHDGWVLGAEFDTPCIKCNGDGRKIKSLSYENYQYKIKRVSRINEKS